MTLTLALLVALIPVSETTSSPGSAAGQPRPAVDVFTSTADVRACAVTEDGGALAATGGGLVRVTATGQTGRVQTRLDGLAGSQVDALAPIDARRWWVGTEEGLAKVTLDDAAPGGLRVDTTIGNEAIVAIAPGTGGDPTFVGTRDAGLFEVSGRTLVAVGYADEVTARRLRVHDLARVDGVWHAATADGVLRRNAAGQWAAWAGTPFSEEVVFSLATSGATLWVGTLGGVFRHHDGRARRVDHADARAIAVGTAGVEVAALGEGILRLSAGGSRDGIDRAAGTTIHGLHRRGTVRCLATQRGMWLGEEGKLRRHLTDGIASRDVSAMAWDPATSQMWVGTFDGGVSVGNGTSWRRVARHEVDPQVNAIALQRVDGATVAWIGTARGLYRVAGEDVDHWSFKEGLPHHHVQALHVRDNGDLIVGTTTGFVMVRDGEVVPDIYGKRPRRWAVWAIAEDADETLWVGTTQGLVRFPKEGKWERLSMLDGVLPDNWVTAVVADGDELWVGTYAKGLARLTRDGDTVRDPEHFGGGRINPGGITLDGARVYAATMGGLRRMTKADPTWQELPDATPGRDVKAVVVAGGRTWVASRRGIRRR